MSILISFLVVLAIIVFVLLQKIRKLENDWAYGKWLLDKTRSVLTTQQKENLEDLTSDTHDLNLPHPKEPEVWFLVKQK